MRIRFICCLCPYGRHSISVILALFLSYSRWDYLATRRYWALGILQDVQNTSERRMPTFQCWATAFRKCLSKRITMNRSHTPRIIKTWAASVDSKIKALLWTSARSKSCNIIIMRNKISALGFTGSHFLSNIPILSGLLDEFLSTVTCRRSVFQSTARKSPESEPVDQETRPALKQSSTNKQWVGKILQKK